jgi:hypothetical protein
MKKRRKEKPVIYKSLMFSASFVVVLTLVGSVATGEIVFFDDFEDGSTTDGAPVTWSPVPGLTGSFEVIDGDYVLTRPMNIEEMFSVVNQYTLADTSIRTQARLIGSNAWWFGLFARGADGTVYTALLKNNARLEIWRFGSSAWTLASANVGIDPRVQDVLLRFDVIGNELSAWAWREGDPMPPRPQVRAVHAAIATAGTVGVAADLGSRLSNNDAVFRYVEVYESIPLSPDFNGDGIVDVKDVVIMTEHWGENYSLCDIGPTPFGDGIVDIQDLVVLTEYIEPIDRTLIAHWALDEAEGIVADDSVGNNDGYVLGDPVWAPDGGQVDGAIYLDGIDDVIIAGRVLNPVDPEISSGFSVIVWIMGGAAGQAVISEPGGANWLTLDPLAGHLMTELAEGGRSASPLLSETSITDGEWHCISFVWDGSNRTLYVDSIAVAQDVQGSLAGSGGGLYIGTGNAMAPGTFFSGFIDDVRIYNRAVEPQKQ